MFIAAGISPEVLQQVCYGWQLWYSQTMEYYSELEHAATCMDPQGIVLSEKSQFQDVT